MNRKVSIFGDNEWNIKIICDKQCNEAKQVLISYLERVSKCQISKNDKAQVTLEIKISNNQNYCYKIEQDKIVIHSNTEDTLLGSVYCFLENELGIKYLSFDCDYIPRLYNIELEIKKYEYSPPFITREIFAKSFGSEHRDFCNKHRINVVAKEKAEMYGCHSFRKILGTELFAEHPEYYALIDGSRSIDGEPCLTNVHVQKIMIDVIAKDFANNPQYNIAHISQNDDANYCRCSKCKKRDQIDGGPIGSILEFVNKVADAFPDKTIVTFAYWYSRKAPKVTIPRNNVVIELCNIEAKPSHPLKSGQVNQGSREELLDWNKVTNNIRYWDYNCQFRNFSSPFPNFENMFTDTKYLSENGVNRIFRQSAFVESGDMWQLRCYLLAKSIWNPQLNWKQVTAEFCDHFYGEASTYIKEYVFLQHQLIRKYDQKLDIFDNPSKYRSTFLALEHMDKYFELFAKAKYVALEPNFNFPPNHLEGKPQFNYLNHVKEAEMSILYAAIYNRYGSREDQLSYIRQFYKLAKKHNLKMLEECDRTPLDKFILSALENV